MSQHDFDIANQTAPSTRADLNLALKALASNSSGASAPATTYANMIYYNTSTNILYKRNEADSAWIALGTVDESLGTFTPSGSPAIASQAEAEAGTENTKMMTPLRVAQAARPLLGTAVATTSGTFVDFTGIPSWAKRVTIVMDGVGTNSTSPKLIQIGDSGGIETTGYVSGTSSGSASGTYLSSSIGYILTYFYNSLAAGGISGSMTLVNISGNTWVSSGSIYDSGYTIGAHFAGTKTLSGVLDRVRITTVNGTDSFDSGSVNIMWE